MSRFSKWREMVERLDGVKSEEDAIAKRSARRANCSR
jgi:hypothetical protein